MNNKTKIIVGACAIVGVIAIVFAFLLSGNKTFSVSFNTNGGSHIPMQEVKKGEKATKPTNPIKEGYSFARWEYQNKEYDFTSSVESDLTLNAIWTKDQDEPQVQKYKITFTVDGQTKTIEASDVSEINLENLGFENKTGYILKWYVNGKEYNFTEPLTSDMSIEGKYEKTTSYTVKFNSNGGSSVASQTVKVGGKATEPTSVKKEGYILDGWYLNNKKYDFNTAVNKNITLVAKWSEDPNVKRYEVKFNSDGGSSVASQKIIENKTVKQPANPTRSGYSFEGWYLGNTKYNFNSKVTSNITLIAKWKELTKYTVEFDTDLGGSNVPSQTVVAGNKATKPSNPTRTGYIFTGWSFNYVDSKQYDFNTPVNSNLLIKAGWVKSVKVTFNSNGGSSVASQTIEMGTKATKPSNPTRSGHTFKGWQLNGSNYTFNEMVLEDITLTAVWEENVVQYTVTFNSNGGSNVPTQTVNAGGTATKPSNPTRSGHTFKRWTLNGSEYNFGSAVNSNITLTAGWEENPVAQYTVTFNSNGGSSVASQTINAGGIATKPSNPTRSHYNFSKWLLNGSEYNFGSAVNSNITLTASWTQKSFTVKKTPVDAYSPDVKLSVLEEGQSVSFTKIMYNGKEVPTTVNGNTISSINSFQVTLTDGTVVTATAS